MPPKRWCSLIATMMTLHNQQRKTSLDKRRGDRPRLTAPGTGRRPLLTLADRLLATALHQRLAPQQVAIATLSGVRPETIDTCIHDTRQLLDRPDTPSSSARTGSPAWKTSPIWPPPVLTLALGPASPHEPDRLGNGQRQPSRPAGRNRCGSVPESIRPVPLLDSLPTLCNPPLPGAAQVGIKTR